MASASATGLKDHGDDTHFKTVDQLSKDPETLKQKAGNPDLDNDGPHKHSCTDIFCLIVFLGFAGFIGYLTSYGNKNGDFRRLTHGFNYEGQLCGVDAAVVDKPMLYFCPKGGEMLGIPTGINTKAPVCVKKCPTVNDTNPISCLSPTAAMNSTVTDATGQVTQVINMISQSKATMPYPTKAILGLYCLPDLELVAAKAASIGITPPVGLRSDLTDSDSPINNAGAKLLRDIGGLRRCTALLVGVAIAAMVLGFVWFALLYLCAKPLVYIAMLLIVLLLASISGFFLMGEYMTSRPPPIQQVAVNGTTAAPTSTTVAPGVIAANATAPVVTRKLLWDSDFEPAVHPLEIEKRNLKDLYGPSLNVDKIFALYAAPSRRLQAATPTVAPGVVPAPPAPAPVPVVPGAATPTAFPPEPTTTYNIQQDAAAKFAAAQAAIDARWNEYGGRKNYEKLNPFYNEHMSIKDAKTASMVTGCIFAAITFIVLCVMFCAHHSIEVAVGVVQVSVKVIMDVPLMLLMPVVDSVVKIIIFFATLGGCILLVSCGHVEAHPVTDIQGMDVEGLRRKFTWTNEQLAYIGTYFFAIFWFLELATAAGQFALSYGVVQWYYTPKSKGKRSWSGIGLIMGYVWGLTVHLGTLAFGSFLVALLRVIIFLLAVFKNASKGDQTAGAAVARCIACIVACCLECIKKCVEHINKNAYIDVAINNSNFCTAAKHVLEFIVQEAGVIALLHGACFIFTVAGMLSIAGTCGYVSYLLCTTNERWTAEDSPHHVSSPRLVAIVATIMSAFIAYSFMMVFDHTADTLLYTYSWNKHHGHNTAEEYAPMELQKLTSYEPLQQSEKKDGGKKAEEKKECSIQ